MAEEIDLNLEDGDGILRPSKGKTMPPDEFEKIKAEKIKEWEEVRKAEMNKPKNRAKVMHK